MTFIVLMFNLFGDMEEIGRFGDRLACETYAWAMHQHVQAINQQFGTLKSIHIVNDKGEDCWKEIMG